MDSGNVSLNIYNSDGRVVRELLHGRPLEIGDHVIHWDGKDYHGSPLPSGEYLWRALVAQSFRSEYQMTLGVTSSPGWRRWPGAYGGIRAICCDKDALYFGAYGPSTILMVKQNDSGERDWEITSSFEPWQGPISLARSADKLYMFQPNGMIYRIDADTSERLGRFDASWNAHVRYVRPFLDKLTADYDDNERQPAISSMAQPKDMACAGSLLAVSYYTHNAIRWYRPETGKLLGQTLIEAPVAIAFDGSGELLVVSKESVYRVKPGEKEPEMLIKEAPGAYRIQVDPVSGDLLIVEERHNIDGQKKTLIARYSSSGEFLRFYGLDQPKQYGPWNPLVFGDISSISCDYHGGFYISDADAPRRIAHFDSGGRLLNEWFGPQWASPSAEIDSQDSHSAWELSEPGRLLHYSVDLRSKKWQIDSIYSYREIANGLFYGVNSGLDYWRVRKLGDSEYLCADNPMRIMKVDPAGGDLIPAACIFQADMSCKIDAVRKKLRELGAVSAQFLWNDLNNDGEIDADELTPITGANWSRKNTLYFSPDLSIACIDRNGLALLKNSNSNGISYSASQHIKLDFKSIGNVVPTYPYIGKSGDIWALCSTNASGGESKSGLVKWSHDGKELFAFGISVSEPGSDRYLTSIVGAPKGAIVAADPAVGDFDIWDQYGLWAGRLLASPNFLIAPPMACRLSNCLEHSSLFEDPVSGSVYLIGVGDNNNPIIKVTGWNEWANLEGTVQLK